MHLFNNYSLGAYLYTALHGSYGIVWIVKELTFPDMSWRRKLTIPSTINNTLFLGSYWYMVYL